MSNFLYFIKIFSLVIAVILILFVVILKIFGHLRRCPNCGSYITRCIKGWSSFAEKNSYGESRECLSCKKKTNIEIPEKLWPK